MLWIATLLSLWKQPRPRSVPEEHHEIPKRDAIPVTKHHPLQAQLLTAFGSRTLEQGLSAWETQNGIDRQLRDTVRAVQQLCYGNKDNVDASTLSRTVESAVAKIRSSMPHEMAAANDPWRPEAFSAKPSRQ